MKRTIILAILCLLMVPCTAYAQGETRDNVRLFQSFFEDAHVTPDLYMDLEFNYSYYDFQGVDSGLYQTALRVGLPINPQTELHTRLGMVHADFDNGSETSLSDLYIGGRHMIIDEVTQMSAGAFATFPTGKAETGEDNFDVGLYTALRHPVDYGIVLTGTAGLIYTEKFFPSRFGVIGRGPGNGEDTAIDAPGNFDGDHKAVLRLGSGAIYKHSDAVHFIGEAVYKSRFDYLMLTGGMDYAIDRKSSLRAAIGVGVDDGAPDVMVSLGCFIRF